MQSAVQVSLSIDQARYRAIADRAAAMGHKPSRYIGMLVDAAYLARVQREKGVDPDDRELDLQVQRVFLLADCEPAFFAEATGIPEGRVAKIIEGWRTIGAELIERPAQPEPAEPAAPVRGEGADDGYPVDTIRQMWADGKPGKEIAKAIGKSEGAFSMWTSKHRDVCPKRRP